MKCQLFFGYPDDANVVNIRYEYMFGREILVAPVTEERVTERRAYFLQGEWYDWDYGYRYEGGPGLQHEGY